MTSQLRKGIGGPSVLEGLVLLVSVAAGVFCYSVWPRYSGDDCFIAYRYAYNIWHHHQYVFNLGERVLATTSPLYTLILAGVQPFSQNLSAVSNGISFICGAVAGWFLFLVLKKDNIAVGLFCAVCFPFVLFNIGLETNFLMLLFCISFYLFTRERYLLCSGILGLAFLTRQDSAIFILCMAIMYCAKERKVAWRELLVFLCVITPWFVFSYVYFGTLFPSSLDAKGGHASFIQYLYNGLSYLARYCDRYNFHVLSLLSEDICRILAPNSANATYVSNGLLVMMYLPVMVLGFLYYLRNAKAHGHIGLVFYGYPTAMVVALSLIGPPPGHRWHLTAAVNFALVGQLIMVTSPFLRVAKEITKNGWTKKWLGICGRVALVFYLGYFSWMNMASFNNFAKNADREPWLGARHESYYRIGRFLGECAAETDKVFALEVGTIGYYSKKTMIDGAGLISPDYDKYWRERCWLKGLKREFPEYIVADEMTIPYYVPVFSHENEFGKHVVYKKAPDLPQDKYPFEELERECCESGLERRADHGDGNGEKEKGRGLLEELMTGVLEKYRQ
jgi:hypothetical protein